MYITSDFTPGFLDINNPEFILGYIVGYCEKDRDDFLHYNEIRKIANSYDDFKKVYNLDEVKQLINGVEENMFNDSDYEKEPFLKNLKDALNENAIE